MHEEPPRGWHEAHSWPRGRAWAPLYPGQRLFKALFVFLVLGHDRRRVAHVNMTDTRTAQQLVEAFPWHSVPRYLLRDRDAIYGVVFSRRAQALGIQEVKIAPPSPWRTLYVERLIETLRRECLTTWWC